jgi:hypothetical protein
LLNDPNVSPFDNCLQVGAIILEIEPRQRHVGFLYKIENRPARIVHLEWHHRLRHEVPADFQQRLRDIAPAAICYWVQCGLAAETRRVLAPVIEQVGSEQQLPVQYSPHYEGIYFDPYLRYQRFAAGDGLTCATLIMAVLQPLGLSLLNEEEWTPRDEDATWHEQIIAKLEQSGDATQEHIDAIRERPRGARFRPEEVAGSMTEHSLPVSFPRAEELGGLLLAEMASASAT